MSTLEDPACSMLYVCVCAHVRVLAQMLKEDAGSLPLLIHSFSEAESLPAADPGVQVSQLG